MFLLRIRALMQIAQYFLHPSEKIQKQPDTYT
jgi:hypothetical protein